MKMAKELKICTTKALELLWYYTRTIDVWASC